MGALDQVQNFQHLIMYSGSMTGSALAGATTQSVSSSISDKNAPVILTVITGTNGTTLNITPVAKPSPTFTWTPIVASSVGTQNFISTITGSGIYICNPGSLDFSININSLTGSLTVIASRQRV